MSDYEQKKFEMELKTFIARNFDKPSGGKNQDQIRFYMSELSHRVEVLEKQFNYVPEWAYSLLPQYNAAQNRILDLEFKNSYC
jgi:hypothetical protein